MILSMKIIRFLTICFTLSFISSPSFANLAFSIDNEEIPKSKILFFGFDSADPNLKADSFEVLEIIRKNLKTTDLFQVFKHTGAMEVSKPDGVVRVSLNENIVQDALTVESIPNFDKYSKAGISAIVIGQFNYSAIGNLEVRIRMWDVLDQRQLFGKFYAASKDNYRKMSNIISDEIFKAISGEASGHFTSKIVYIEESGPLKKRVKKVRLMDFDGFNNQVLTDGRDLVLTPIFSKRRDQIFYLRYFKQKSQIFSLNLSNMRSQKVGGFRGTTYAASINPIDSNQLLLAAIVDNNSDIYELDIEENKARRLTKNHAIDTTPAYSPDGKYITYTSDREAGQQIYVMRANGFLSNRISFGGGSYSKPVWSPDGKLIAFTKMKNGKFYIGVIAPNGKGEKLLTSAYLAEGAKWSPNSRYLIYAKKRAHYGEKSISRLFIIDVVTGFEFEVPTPKESGASDPDWV